MKDKSNPCSKTSIPVRGVRFDHGAGYVGMKPSTYRDHLNPESPRFDPDLPKTISVGVGCTILLIEELDNFLDKKAEERDSPERQERLKKLCEQLGTKARKKRFPAHSQVGPAALGEAAISPASGSVKPARHSKEIE